MHQITKGIWITASLLQLLLTITGFSTDKWLPPPPSTCKLNFDKSLNPFTQFTRMGGILRNSDGRMLFTFIGMVMAETPLQGELQALIKGVSMCLWRGFGRLILDGPWLHHPSRIPEVSWNLIFAFLGSMSSTSAPVSSIGNVGGQLRS